MRLSCFFSLAVVALLGLTSCKKNVDSLPDPTEAGSNTFGAKVNGALWVPQSFGVFNQTTLEARLLGNNFYLKAQNFASSPVETEFDITIIGLTGTGTYDLNMTATHPSQVANYGYYVKRNLNPINEWITSPTNTGTVTITRFDTTARVIAGTFQFTAGEINNGAAPLSVTEGRFDVRY